MLYLYNVAQFFSSCTIISSDSHCHCLIFLRQQASVWDGILDLSVFYLLPAIISTSKEKALIHTHTHKWFPSFNGWVTPPLNMLLSPEQVYPLLRKQSQQQRLPVRRQSAWRDGACRETSFTDEMQCSRRVRLKETRRSSVFCGFLVSVPVEGFNSKPLTSPLAYCIYRKCVCVCMCMCASLCSCVCAHSHSSHSCLFDLGLSTHSIPVLLFNQPHFSIT